MAGPSNDDLLLDAQRLLEIGQQDHAIDILCRLLGRDPNRADAHAILAMVLIDQGRLHAARQEASIALSLEPDSAFCHYAAAVVAMLQLRYREAYGFIEAALALEPGDPDFIAGRGRLLILEERWREAGESFLEALAAEPDHLDAMVGLGEAYLNAGFLDDAERTLSEALSIAPANSEALTQMGWLHLKRDRLEEAREHALWVLAQNADDSGALSLLTAVKARENWFLSLWWRFNSWMTHKSEGLRIGILVGLYLVFQIASTLLRQNDMSEAASYLMFVWIGFCLYTWVGPAVFEKRLQKELEKVRLQPDF